MCRSADFFMLVLLVVGQPATSAAGAMAGTWKLNVARSLYELSPAPKSEVLRFERSDDGWKASEDVNYVDGSWTHRSFPIKFDGNDYPIAPILFATWAFTKVDDHTYDVVEKRRGRTITITRTVISPDGNTRTSTAVGTNEEGRTVQNIAVYERQ